MPTAAHEPHSATHDAADAASFSGAAHKPESIELLLCRFGHPPFEVEPALSSFKRFFPHARTVLYSDEQRAGDSSVFDELRVVTPPYDPSHGRYGWRASDLYRAVGMLESKADVAVYTDSDIFFCSERVLSLPQLARTFGFCLPQNPRILARWDALAGADSDKQADDAGGWCMAYNTAPLAFHTGSAEARRFLETYVKLMTEAPGRSPLAIHRAVMRSGFSPFVLPFQWCVCEEHIGIGDEVVLHVGHKRVRDYYLGSAPRWLKEFRRLAFLVNRLALPKKRLKQIVKHWKHA